MRSTVSIGGKVKKTPSSLVDADRYSFLKLSDAEPDFGVPPANEALISSDTSGNRSWLNLAGGLKIESGEIIVDETTLPIDTSGLNYSSSTTLDGVLSDIDDAIVSAVAGSLDAVNTDDTLNGTGTDENPLTIADNAVGEDELKVSGGPGVLGQVMISDGAGEMIWGPHHSVGAHTTTALGEQVFDTFDAASYRAGKYKIAIASLSGAYHFLELNFLSDGSNVSVNQINDIFTTDLGTFGGRISGGNVELLFTPAFAENELRFTRELISISGFEATFPQDLDGVTFGDIDLQTQTFDPIDLQV